MSLSLVLLVKKAYLKAFVFILPIVALLNPNKFKIKENKIAPEPSTNEQ